MPRVLIVEDDQDVRSAVQLGLRHQGHVVLAVGTGEEGLEQLRAFRPDVVVLDLMLPGISGLDVCRRIRRRDQVPIIMVTARGDDIDMVVGLESGADDYVVKPVRARVLNARIRAVLRRQDAGLVDGTRPRPEAHGELVVDRAGLVVTHRGEPVTLAPPNCGCCSRCRPRPARCSAASNCWRRCGSTATTVTYGSWTPA